MKKILLATLLACFSLVLSAQDPIPVSVMGDRPNIGEFAWAYLSYEHALGEDEEEGSYDESINAVYNAWVKYRDHQAQDPDTKLNVDQKNGFVLYEWTDGENQLRVEMCYWNEADGKHKLFACGVYYFQDGRYSPGQFDGLTFCRYDNATHMMTYSDAGFDVEYGTDDGAWVSYALPRSGKDITVSYWYSDGSRKDKTLKWNGSGFSF